MSKNTKPQRVVLDYDKLAEAIVKAEQKARAEENKIDDTAYLLKVLLVVSFICVTAFMWMFFGTCIYGKFIGMFAQQNAAEIIAFWAMTLLSLGYAITTTFLTYKVSKINDRSYLINYFAAITGLLALVISLVDFFKR